MGQLNWRIHPGALTIGESALHVAGVEVSFISQLTGEPLDEFGAKLKSASTDGVVNHQPFPFHAGEITPELVRRALATGRQMVQAHIDPVTDAMRAVQIKSALGPIIDGTGAFARIAYHPGYHQGQVYMVKTAPGFPGG